MASLVVLTNCGEGIVSSCEDDRATQVNSTGRTTINMSQLINASHLIIDNYSVSYFKSKL